MNTNKKNFNPEAFSVLAHAKIRDHRLDDLKEILQELKLEDLIFTFQEMDDSDLPVLFRLLPKDRAIEVFEMMDPAQQGDLIHSFSSEEAVLLLQELDPDDQVRLLDELPAKVAKRLMEALPREHREKAALLMGYLDGTVGRIMSPVLVGLKEEMTASQALEQIRTKHRASFQEITTVYILDETRHLVGVLPLSMLVIADPHQRLATLIQDQTLSVVHTYDDQEEAANLLQKLDRFELPVLDRDERLVGVLTVDDAMDVIREETTDDMYDKVGIVDITKRETDRSFKLVHGNFFHSFIVRVPFLLITMAGGMAAGVVIDAFEEILSAVVATAFFIPVIMDMGGNVGTQSSTIFTRAMVLGQIRMKRFAFHWIKETLHGAGMGIVLGTIGGLIAGVWQQMPELGLAVGLALAMTITLGVTLGFLVPFILIKLGFDQAAGADPIITTIKDMCGLLIYFALVSSIMPHIIG